MKITKLSRFLLQVIGVGLAAAIVVLLILPDSDTGKLPVVEVQQTAAPDLPRGQGPVSYAAAVQRAAPAVVNIFTARTVVEPSPLQADPFFGQFENRGQGARKRTQTSLGSGVIISQQGYLLTNNHVIVGAEAIAVLLADGRSFEAHVVGTDPDRVVLVGCPKFDDRDEFVAKFTRIFRVAGIRSVTVVIMEVPCCSALPAILERAVEKAGVRVPMEVVVLGTRGEILDREARPAAARGGG